MSKATRTVNSYFAVLLITIVGAVAALIIIKVAYLNTTIITKTGYSQQYASLQKSILNNSGN